MRLLILTVGSLIILGSQAAWISNPPTPAASPVPIAPSQPPAPSSPPAPVPSAPAASANINDNQAPAVPPRADAATSQAPFSFDAGAFAQSIAQGITNGLGGQIAANQSELLAEIRSVKAELRTQIQAIPPPAPPAVIAPPKAEPRRPTLVRGENNQIYFRDDNGYLFALIDPRCPDPALERLGLKAKATAALPVQTASMVTAAPAVMAAPVATLADPVMYSTPAPVSYGTTYGSFGGLGSGLFGGMLGGVMSGGGSCGSGGCR